MAGGTGEAFSGSRLTFVASLFQLAALEFPPKKLFGNRDERVVAERRNHLEARDFQVLIDVFCVVVETGGDCCRPCFFFFFTALPEGLVPHDAVLLELAARSRRGFPPHQTRRLRVLTVLQEGRLRVQQPRHRLTPATCRRPARTRSEGLHFFMEEEHNGSFISTPP